MVSTSGATGLIECCAYKLIVCANTVFDKSTAHERRCITMCKVLQFISPYILSEMCIFTISRNFADATVFWFGKKCVYPYLLTFNPRSFRPNCW